MTKTTLLYTGIALITALIACGPTPQAHATFLSPGASASTPDTTNADRSPSPPTPSSPPFTEAAVLKP